eukprot:TRINITY_DN24458_c0_g1_i1.p1 TRINITY_DN24458_c0_g1~~TRINITY_DN24458_c0_g1_i1.p1  ORF type:complete len:155 (-),score=19.88 TRINITY_DN24458_c0_g1_i1:394-858(-)
MGWKAAQKVFMKWDILRGDKVMVIAGKDKGLVGTISKVIRSENRVVVHGRNLVKKHIKKTDKNPGGIVTMEAPLHVSNVQLVDPVNGAPCRVTYRFLEDGTKVRVSTGGTASGSIIPRPEILRERRKPRPNEPGPKDTLSQVVLETTYIPQASA